MFGSDVDGTQSQLQNLLQKNISIFSVIKIHKLIWLVHGQLTQPILLISFLFLPLLTIKYNATSVKLEVRVFALKRFQRRVGPHL